MMIVCRKCGKFFHPRKNGVAVEEGMPSGLQHPDGTPHWQPYKLWMADSLQCKNCETEIIAGFGLAPISEHYMPDYQAVRTRLKPIVFVEDCI